jgi:predicted O-methyltransferase YrrM
MATSTSAVPSTFGYSSIGWNGSTIKFASPWRAASDFGPGFGYIEAQCLHGVLRFLKPRRLIEVGSGISTSCAMRAIGLNAEQGSNAKITCIEPHPSDFLCEAERTQSIELIKSPVQILDPDSFLELGAGDFLFIDSTHAIKPGGDVLYLYLQVLPKLKPGAIVHTHDIYFPYVYQPDLLKSLFQWSETALLQALLTHNSQLSVLFCLSQLHHDAPDVLGEVFPEYVRQSLDDGLTDATSSGHFPASIYLQTA